MAMSQTERKAGAAGRHKAARPIQNRQIGKRAPQSKHVSDGTSAADRSLDRLNDSTLTRSERRSHSGEPRAEGPEGDDR
jgi:hypothetical protein